MSFGEIVEKYVAQGYSYNDAYERARRYMYNHKRYEEQKKVRDVINQMKVSDPKKYAELMYRATHEEEIRAREREEERIRYEEARRLEEEKLFKFRHSLVTAGIPDIDFSDVEGLVAFRTWDVRDDKLGSTAMRSVWNSQMIADRIPTPNNNNGLYCVKLDPLGLMTRASYYLGEVCGLLELRGKVLEHTDGVVRAEWARIMCVFIQANENTENNYQGLCYSYPTVPFYVLHKEQIAEVLLRVTVMQSVREANDG